MRSLKKAELQCVAGGAVDEFDGIENAPIDNVVYITGYYNHSTYNNYAPTSVGFSNGEEATIGLGMWAVAGTLVAAVGTAVAAPAVVVVAAVALSYWGGVFLANGIINQEP